MAESKVRNESYYQVSGWMLNRLQLKGIELDVYAIIHGFSQDGESSFTGSLQYLSDFTNSTKPTVIKALKSLVEKGYIVKNENQANGVKFNTYQANLEVVKKLYWGSKEILPGSKETLPGGSKETLPGGSKETLPNNKSLNNKDLDNKEDKKGPAPSPARYGEYENVILTDKELEKLKTEFPYDWQERIDRLSSYIAQSGKKYQNHLATIRNWARRDAETGTRGRAAKGRKEPVPAWMDKPQTEQDLKSKYDKLLAQMRGEPEPATIGNDPALAARAENLRQKLGQT